MSKKHEPPQYALPVRFDPSGLRTTADALYVPYVPPVIWTRTRWPAVPGKETTLFWPGTVVVAVTCGPPGVVATAASAGTSYTWTVIVPVVVDCGSTTRVYVPSVGRTVVSRKQEAPQEPLETTVPPPGLRSVTAAL